MAAPIAGLLFRTGAEALKGLALSQVNPWVTSAVRIYGGDLVALADVAGVRLPRLTGYLTGAVKPATSTINRLRSAYGKTAYNMLRSAGAPVAFAQKWKYSAPNSILEKIEYLDKLSKSIGELMQIEQADAIKGLAESKKDPEDWEDYNEMLTIKRMGLV